MPKSEYCPKPFNEVSELTNNQISCRTLSPRGNDPETGAGQPIDVSELHCGESARAATIVLELPYFFADKNSPRPHASGSPMAAAH